MASKNMHYETSTSNFVSFSDIGGLSDQIQQIRELIVFPLIYRNVFNHFKIRPPRGVLFHGPPGTGKTLVAGAVARECSKEINGRVTFFSRKGADILDKWVGESENKLRKLFEQAAEKSPSIIFFDEIDGLAPIRSLRQDQVHSSVVATLLALMDGLDSLPGVVVIGATNRLDAIDPALRRAGRFDRELYFPIPTYKGRLEILLVHTKYWQIKPKPSFLAYLADITVGYCGSDLQALCSEAVMSSLRRNFPCVTKLRTKINARLKNLQITEIDFLQARASISPSVDREIRHMRKLSSVVQPLLQKQLDRIVFLLETKAPHFTDSNSRYNIGSARYAARLLITGNSNQGHNNHIVPAILHVLEHMPSYVIDIQALYKTSYTSSEEICVQKLLKARQNVPSIVLTYRLDKWWNIIQESTKAIIVSLLEELHAGLPILIIATATEDLPECLINYFNNNSSILYKMQNPDEEERMAFLYPLFMEKVFCKCLSPSDVDDALHKDPSYVTQLLFSKTKNLKNNKDDLSFWHKYETICNKMTRNRLDINYYLEYENCNFSGHESEHKKYKYRTYAETKPGVKRKWSDSASNSSLIHKVRKTANNHVHKARKNQKRLSTSSSSETYGKLVKTPSPPPPPSPQHAEIETYFYNDNFESTIQEQSGLIHLKKHLQDMNVPIRKVIKDTSGLNFGNFPKKSKNLTDFKQQDNLEQTVSKYDKLASLFRRAVTVTTHNMTVVQLELLYDMLITCISRLNQDPMSLLDNIEKLLNETEMKAMELLE